MAVTDSWVAGQSFAATDENNVAKAINGSGWFVPVHYSTTGAESFTISSGTVTQIAGTTIDGGSPAVGERILVKDAPAATGSGSAFSTNPANGIYAVVSNTTNLTLARVYEMSATPATPYNPAGGAVVVMAGTVNATALLVVTTPNAPGTFTWGVGNIGFNYPAPLSGLANASMTFNNKSISGATNTITALPLSSLASGVYATAPGALKLAQWDANLNLSANNFFAGYNPITSAAGTTVLTAASASVQVVTGTTTQTIQLASTGLPGGAETVVINASTGAVTVQTNGGTTIVILAAGTVCTFIAEVAAPTTAANWSYQYMGITVATGKKFTVNNSITFTGTDSTTFTLPTATDTLAGIAATQIFTNKTIKPRIGTVASSATPAVNIGLYDVVEILALATAITSMTSGLTGTAFDGQKILWRFKDTGTAEAITWGASFVSSGVATLLATTSPGKIHNVLTQYDSTKAAHVCMAVDATGY